MQMSIGRRRGPAVVAVLALLVLSSTPQMALTASSSGQAGDGTGMEAMQAPISRAGPYATEDNDFVYIGNDHLEIVLQKSTMGGIHKIVDKATGLDLRPEKVPPSLMFIVIFDNGSGIEVRLQWDAQGVTYELTPGTGSASSVRVTYSNVAGYDLDVNVTIGVTAGRRYAEMGLDLATTDPLVIKSVNFPVIWGLGPIGAEAVDDVLLYPMGDGLLIHDPLTDIMNSTLFERYPSSASMRLMAHYDPDEAGLYLADHDPTVRIMDLIASPMEWSAQQYLSLQNSYLLPEDTGVHEVASKVALGTFNGDWYDAADIYKAAAPQSFLEGGKVLEGKDTPPWFANTSIIQMVNRDDPAVEHNSLAKIADVTHYISDLTGLNTTVMIHGWEGNGAWVGPYYYPPAEGNASFRSAMDALDTTGDRGFTYISGTVWRITRDDIGYADHDLFNTTGLPWVATNATGDPTFDPFYESLGWHSARMDPMTDFWHDMVVFNAIESVRLGAQVVQVDEFPIGSIYPCYNTSHGHRPGFTSEIIDAYRSILGDIRTEGRAMQPDLVVSMEEPSEVYLRDLDIYVSRDNAPESLLYGPVVERLGDRAEFIPLFSQVYHEYVISFGEHLPMDTSYPMFLYRQVARALARTFVQGEVQNAVATDIGDIRPGLLELYNRTATATAIYANEYLIGGRPLRPVELDVPEVTVDWYNWYGGGLGTPFHEKAVLTSSWEADDGDIGIVFVNWDNDTHDLTVQVPSYGLPEGNYSILITTNGLEEVLLNRTELPVEIQLSMAKNDVVLLTITQVPDLTVGPEDVVCDLGQVFQTPTGIEVTVHNIGTGDAVPFNISLSVNGTNGTGWVPFSDERYELTIGASDNQTLGTTWDMTGLHGNLTLRVVVDALDENEELHEDNNEVLIPVTVPPRAASLHVTVKENYTYYPVPYAEVSLLKGNDTEPVATDDTNDTGEAHLTWLVPGLYRLRVERSDLYDPSEATAVLTEYNTTHVEVILDWSTPIYPTVSGTVIDNSTKEPIEGANVTILHTEQGPVFAWTLTDANGEYGIKNVWIDYGYISVHKEGYYIQVLPTDISMFHSDFDFFLEPIVVDPGKGSIQGNVTDAGTGDILEGATLTVDSPQLTVVSDEEGKYLLKDLEAGNYTVHATMEPDYQPQSRNVTVVGGAVAQLDFDLVRRTEPPPPKELPVIQGYVLGPEDVPMEDADVSVINLVGTKNVTTDADGFFRFEDLQPGIYVFRAEAAGYVSNLTPEISVDYDDVVNVTIHLRKRPKPVNGGRDESWFVTMRSVFILIGIIVFIVIGLALLIMQLRKRRLMRKVMKGEVPPPSEEAGHVPTTERTEGGGTGGEEDE